MSILRDHDADAEAIIRALNADARFMIMVQDPDAEIDNSDDMGPRDSVIWFDAADASAAADLAVSRRDQGWPVVVIFENTGQLGMPEVFDLSAPALPVHRNDPRSEFAGSHCERCAAYYSGLQSLWADSAN